MNIKDEFGLDTLDSGGSRAFALTDHQVAHIYLQENDPFSSKVKAIHRITGWGGYCFGRRAEKQAGLDHPVQGDLIALAEEDAWFSYYFWEDDEKAQNLPAVLIFTGNMGMIRPNYLWIPKFHFQHQSCTETYRQKTGLPYPYGFNPIGCKFSEG